MNTEDKEIRASHAKTAKKSKGRWSHSKTAKGRKDGKEKGENGKAFKWPASWQPLPSLSEIFQGQQKSKGCFQTFAFAILSFFA